MTNKKVPPLGSSTQLAAHSDIVSRNMQGETVLLNLRSGTYFGLNESGTFVWETLKKGVDFGTLLDSFESQYQVSPKRAEEDLRLLLGELHRRELIQLA